MEIEKRWCVRLRSGNKHHLRKSADRKAQIWKALFPLTGLICAFRSADFLRWCLSSERNLTHNIIGSAEALPILCVRYFRWERERLIPKTIGNRKRDCAWGCAWGINTTWENLQIEKHKSVRWAERTPSWFVLFDLQIFSGGVYSPSATSRKISFSISNSFWY